MPARLALAATFVLLAVGAASAQELVHTKDSLATVKENVQAGKGVIVDVREPREWEAGHLKGAILAPQSKLTVEQEAKTLIQKLPKDKIIYTHCRAGGRALACGEILKQHGFDVRPLKAGFDDLVKAGFEKAEPKP
ncbi:MAG: rhodanese-like domain-containing protein [Pirellulaceae bacterium]